MNSNSNNRSGIVGLLVALLGISMFVILFFFLTRRESEPARLVQRTNTPSPISTRTPARETPVTPGMTRTPTVVPIRPPTATPTPHATEQGAANVVAQRVRVDARQAWQIAVGSVRQGDSVTIEYLQGTWAVWGGPGGVRNRADGVGYTDEQRSGSPLASAPVGALIGRIGGGEPFYVGNGIALTASESGALAFQINDTMRGDNTGALWLSVTVTQPGADATPAGVAPTVTPPAQVPMTQLARLGKPVNQVAFAPDGKTLAVASSPGIHLYDTETLAETRAIDTTTAVMSVAFAPDGQLLASGSHPDGAVQLWRVSDGTLLRTLEGHAHGVWSVAFSPDGQTLASGSLDKTVRLWQVAGCLDQSGACGTLLHTLPGHNTGVISVAFSPDGQTLAVGAWDNGTVWLWRSGEGELLNTLHGGGNRVTSVAFSPEQPLLASASQDGRVLLWRTLDGTLWQTLGGHPDVVYSVAFAPDGQTLAAGTLDNTVWLWRISDGARLAILDGGTALVTSVAFSPDGQTLVVGSHDGTVQLWDLAAIRQ